MQLQEFLDCSDAQTCSLFPQILEQNVLSFLLLWQRSVFLIIIKRPGVHFSVLFIVELLLKEIKANIMDNIVVLLQQR